MCSRLVNRSPALPGIRWTFSGNPSISLGAQLALDRRVRALSPEATGFQERNTHQSTWELGPDSAPEIRDNSQNLCSLKEVIQPHLPVQLPCYDFVPVTKPDLGACLPCGLAQRLQSFSASMT